MASVVNVDCTTGRATTGDATAGEITANQQLQADIQKAEQARQADEAARDATLAKVAAKVGVDLEELKSALRVKSVTKPGKS